MNVEPIILRLLAPQTEREPAVSTQGVDPYQQDDISTGSELERLSLMRLESHGVRGDVTAALEDTLEHLVTWHAGSLELPLSVDSVVLPCVVSMGRRPLGFVEDVPVDGQLGTHFATCAYLEEASVMAFTELGQQLRRWNAGDVLVQRCERAAADEALHAKVFKQLARGLGARSMRPIYQDGPSDQLTVAMHNAAEGCVFATWSALVLGAQALRSTSPALSRLYALLLQDEICHSQLAWDIHDWLMLQLTSTEQDLVLQALREALDHLLEIAAAHSPHAVLGRPGSHDALILARRMIGAMAA